MLSVDGKHFRVRVCMCESYRFFFTNADCLFDLRILVSLEFMEWFGGVRNGSDGYEVIIDF